jgi:hypothetical protein
LPISSQAKPSQAKPSQAKPSYRELRGNDYADSATLNGKAAGGLPVRARLVP